MHENREIKNRRKKIKVLGQTVSSFFIFSEDREARRRRITSETSSRNPLARLLALLLMGAVLLPLCSNYATVFILFVSDDEWRRRASIPFHYILHSQQPFKIVWVPWENAWKSPVRGINFSTMVAYSSLKFQMELISSSYTAWSSNRQRS